MVRCCDGEENGQACFETLAKERVKEKGKSIRGLGSNRVVAGRRARVGGKERKSSRAHIKGWEKNVREVRSNFSEGRGGRGLTLQRGTGQFSVQGFHSRIKKGAVFGGGEKKISCF